MKEDEDDFWKVALEEEPTNNRDKNGIWDDDDSDSNDIVSDKPAVAYQLPTNKNTTLNLESLATSDGIWSPLGADAWYASALLATMVLTNDMIPMQTSTKTVLELGSGAVGLSGLACAVAMARKHKMEGRHKIILTDNDPPVLEKLRRNVEQNQDKIISSGSKPSAELDIVVQHLDWNEECDESFRHSIDLVIGSELVYTQETGEACSKMLERLLTNNPSVDIWVVQVTDRYGWLDIVVPRLESLKDVSVVSVPIPSDIHTLASSMIPMGGTLDRHAYGAFHIQNRAAKEKE